MSDIVKRLRWPPNIACQDDLPAHVALRKEAADEIERLREELDRDGADILDTGSLEEWKAVVARQAVEIDRLQSRLAAGPTITFDNDQYFNGVRVEAGSYRLVRCDAPDGDKF